ncbi:MAG: hypothetical protein WDO06_05625 [Actinomycetota bacterium]
MLGKASTADFVIVADVDEMLDVNEEFLSVIPMQLLSEALESIWLAILEI